MRCVSVAGAGSTEGRTGPARGAARWALGSPGPGYDALVGETVRDEEMTIELPDGRSVALMVNATPIRSMEGAVESVVVAAQDMTALAEDDRLRAEFLGMIGHELRSPLAAIKGSAIRVEAVHDKSHVAVSVADSGRGMPAERLAHRFAKFTRPDGHDQGRVRHSAACMPANPTGHCSKPSLRPNSRSAPCVLRLAIYLELDRVRDEHVATLAQSFPACVEEDLLEDDQR